jgi:hypothetical protein
VYQGEAQGGGRVGMEGGALEEDAQGDRQGCGEGGHTIWVLLGEY